MKHLRLSQEQLDAMLAKSRMRVVAPMGSVRPTRGKDKQKRLPGRLKQWVDKWACELTRQIFLAGLESPKREFKFAASLGRRYRADLAYPSRLLLIEIDGGCHAVKARWREGILRGQIAQQLGYRIITVLPEQVQSGEALKLVEEALAK